MLERLKTLALGRLALVWDRMPQSLRQRVLFAANDRFLIGVVGLLTDDQDRVLLLEHRFRTPWRWGLPGGFMARGETMEAGLVREIMEEVALAVEVEPEPIDWEMNTRVGYLSVTLRGRTQYAPQGLEIQSSEILSGGFYGIHELPQGLYPYHRALVIQHLGG